MTAMIAPAGTIGSNPQWQIKLENRVSWLNTFALQNCTGGPTPGPVVLGTGVASALSGQPIQNPNLINAATSMLASAIM